jgi:hypothetical protein
VVAFGTFVLSRRLGRPPDRVASALPVLVEEPSAGLTFVTPFVRRVSGAFHPGERTATAFLRAGRRCERIELEVGPWSEAATEIRLRPDARRPERWSGRRAQRYFRHAHDTADDLVTRLELLVPATARAVDPERRSA